MDKKFAVIINEDNIPQEITIHNTFDEAIDYIHETHEIYDEDKEDYISITKKNFKKYFELSAGHHKNLWIQKNWEDHPIDENIFIMQIGG